MSLLSFQDLLDASHQQTEPQRLLLVFARIALPEAATDAQRERFAAGEGGTISPVTCVDKAPSEIASFQALAEESAATGLDWDVVFVSSMGGHAGIAPGTHEATQPLQFMVNAINNGRVSDFAAFDRAGEPLRFS